jgi:hypothetical protein
VSPTRRTGPGIFVYLKPLEANVGRKKKQTDIEDAIKEAPRTNSELTEDERRALHFRHCAEYERAMDAKKKADAGVKNVGKRIKAENDGNYIHDSLFHS